MNMDIKEKDEGKLMVNNNKNCMTTDFLVYDCARGMKLVESNFLETQISSFANTDWSVNKKGY